LDTDTANHILVIGGMCVLSFGLLLGIPMVVARSEAPRAPRYLLAAHLAAIIHGVLLLALTVALGSSSLSSGMATTAASLLVAGIVFFDIGLALNWLQGVQDGFGEKTLGNKISGLGTPLVLVGTGIIFFGVLAGL
jgi:hypothetical protein